jgi:hypothetical protein
LDMLIFWTSFPLARVRVFWSAETIPNNLNIGGEVSYVYVSPADGPVRYFP